METTRLEKRCGLIGEGGPPKACGESKGYFSLGFRIRSPSCNFVVFRELAPGILTTAAVHECVMRVGRFKQENHHRVDGLRRTHAQTTTLDPVLLSAGAQARACSIAHDAQPRFGRCVKCATRAHMVVCPCTLFGESAPRSMKHRVCNLLWLNLLMDDKSGMSSTDDISKTIWWTDRTKSTKFDNDQNLFLCRWTTTNV